MAYDIIGARGYGSAEQGDATNPASINHYASVSATGSNSITVNDASNFPVGTEILMHIAGAKTSAATADNLGKYKFAKVMSVDGNVLTLSAAPLSISTSAYYYQAISVPHYKTLTISETISPPAFNDVGGLLVFKAHKLVMSGSIDLAGKGLTSDSQRLLTAQEQNGTLDTDQQSGYENEAAATNLTLQVGDGACLILAKRIDFKSTARIGNPSGKGIARCRGAADSLNRNSSYSNVGGSSIAIIADTINSFSASVISKYRSGSGKGLARCYIATESILPFDEGLFSYDIISKPERLSEETLIDGFGDGSLGVAQAPSSAQNNYAKVTAITNGGKTFALTGITTNGIAKFVKGALVMIHASNLNDKNFNHVGRFFLSKVIGTSNNSSGKLNSITLEHSIDELKLTNFNTDKYLFQAIAIPQYTSFSGSNSATRSFQNGSGGIFAIAVNGVCDLLGQKINVEGKGGNKFSGDYTSNARMKNRLPIGEGHGSVFILAKTLKVNTSTRIGATYTGNSYGGASNTHDGGGYRGETATNLDERGGSGYRGGQCDDGNNGGFFSNAAEIRWYGRGGGLQGASIFIVADSIAGLCLDCLSTGGQGGKSAWINGRMKSSVVRTGSDGGCGYGGGGATFTDWGNPTVTNNEAGAGGVHGGGSGDSSGSVISNGGGASGFCVVYHN